MRFQLCIAKYIMLQSKASPDYAAPDFLLAIICHLKRRAQRASSAVGFVVHHAMRLDAESRPYFVTELLQLRAASVNVTESEMSFAWITWTNPVAVWWAFLVTVSAANIASWALLRRQFQARATSLRSDILRIEIMVLLCAAYVFGCAFRSLLPRADVQRIVLFDTWLSSVFVGRSVATIAEVCFIIQWAIVLRYLGKITKSDTVTNVSKTIVPVIIVAELCSWYAVVTTNYLGNGIENSLWAVAFTLIAIALCRLLYDFFGIVRIAIATMIAGIAFYVAFLVTVDVPMYLGRWHADLVSGKELLGLFSGFYDVATRWVVTHDIGHWRDEVPWMSLYFSAAVWSSLALCSFDLVKHHLPRYRRRLAIAGPARRPLPVRAGGGRNV